MLLTPGEQTAVRLMAKQFIISALPKSLLTFVALATILAFLPNSSPLYAQPATIIEMDQACRAFLAEMCVQEENWQGGSQPRILQSVDLKSGGLLLGRIYDITPAGFVLVTASKNLPPIKAYSTSYRLDSLQTDGFLLMLKSELEEKLTEIKCDKECFYVSSWKSLLSEKSRCIPHRGGGPLLTSSWHQQSPYNRDCPIGDGARCITGCVATAMAQILKFWQWPPHGVGNHAYLWDGDNSCGNHVGGGMLSADFLNLYRWSKMPDSCDNGCPEADSLALGKFNYDVAGGLETDFGVCWSASSSGKAITAYKNFFMFSPQIGGHNRNNFTAEEWFNLIKSEINSGRPIHAFISGHSIVIDGWRLHGDRREYHVNYGWGGPFTAWYVMDSIPQQKKSSYEYLLTNIVPQTRPVLSFAGYMLSDTIGDGDGLFDPSEVVEIFPAVCNDGYRALNVEVTISTTDSFLTLVDSCASFGDSIAWGYAEYSSTSCKLTSTANIPNQHITKIYLQITCPVGTPVNDSFQLFIGNKAGFMDGVENGIEEWSLLVPPSNNQVNEWHLENNRVHGGAYSWKAGGLGQDDYANNSYSRLVTPPLLLPPKAELRFWHWIEAEILDFDSSAQDGGQVYISNGYNNWTLLVPQGGYPFSSLGQPCYSGSQDWSEAVFDLEQFSGVVQFMFLFFSNRGGTREGWYLDDLLVEFTGLCGDANDDGSLDISDVVFDVNYLFFPDAPAPEPYCLGDVNGDGTLDVSDAVYLINFIFASGPAVSGSCCDMY